MKRCLLALAAIALGAAGTAASAQQVGSSLPADVELEGFTQTGAKSYGDLFGRTVLLEFFAYW